MTTNPGPKRTAEAFDKSSHRPHFPWVRLWVELPHDPKLRTIARNANTTVANVLAVLVTLLADAANAPERGSPTIETEDLASGLDLEHVQVAAIIEAMQGRVLDRGRLAGWERRQPKREDGSAERSKAWREENANATERNRTRGDARGEERRVEERIKVKGASREQAPPRATFHLPDDPRVGGEAASLPLADGSEALISPSHKAELARLFPALDVDEQLRAMRSWLIGKPKNRKTRSGVLAFVSGWLTREQNRARGSGTTSKPETTNQRLDREYAEQFKARKGIA